MNGSAGFWVFEMSCKFCCVLELSYAGFVIVAVGFVSFGVLCRFGEF